MNEVSLNIQKTDYSQKTSKILQNGSQVLVRIAQNLGQNKYLGYVSGAKVNIYSTKSLNSGDVFKANIFIKDGVLTLKTQENQNIKIESKLLLQNLTQDINQLNQTSQNQISTELATFLQNIGMVPDNLSKIILQEMKNLGLKYDASLMNQIYREVKKYGKNSQLALEMIMNLIQKGVSFDSEQIQSVLDSLESAHHKNKEIDIIDKYKDELTKNDIKEFCLNIFNNVFNNQIGLLSISNSLKTRKDISSNGSWLMFPYQVLQNEQVVCSGIFRLLLIEEKIQKFCIESNKDDLNSLFVLEFKNNECFRIRFCQKNSDKSETTQGLEDFKIENQSLYNSLKEKIKKSGYNIDLVIDEWKNLCNNCFGSEEIFMLNGEV